EHGSGDLHYNKGTLDNRGVGGLAGVIVKLNDRLDFSILGGAEWLNYQTTRTGGLYTGEYDAIRYIVDAQLRGKFDAANYFIEYGTGLRYIRQDNDAYQEYSGGSPFASVPGSGFTVLTGLADLKLGTKLPGITPYVQATGYVNFLENTDFAASFGAVTPEDQKLSGRLGIGADIDFLSGRLSLVAGIFGGEDGFEGADGGFKFSKGF
ncbi:MAG: autotransporter domain-containing protein, partial [Mesorhizobium sp.]